MVSGTQLEPNLATAAQLIGEAARAGARLIVLPEYFCLMGRRDIDKVALREADGKGPIQEFLAGIAREHGIWLVGGTLPLAAPEPTRVFNTVLVFDPHGRRAARYDKIHLFAFRQGEESYDEARTIAPGSEPVAFDCALGATTLRIGLSVCYDLRFPELYRRLGARSGHSSAEDKGGRNGKHGDGEGDGDSDVSTAGSGVDLILVPAAFTATTGKAHWETLLRSRAIENLCYVLASAQGGQHENGRATFGHSMLVDPWGAVLARQESGPGVVIGTIDPDRIAACRASLPALAHRVLG